MNTTILTVIPSLVIGCLLGVTLVNNSVVNELKSIKTENIQLKSSNQQITTKYTDNQQKINQFCSQFRSK